MSAPKKEYYEDDALAGDDTHLFDATEPQTFEGDVKHLLAVVRRTAKSISEGDPRRIELEQAAETVSAWGENENEDPQQMGWVGSDGRP